MTLKNDLLVYIYKNNEPTFSNVAKHFNLTENELYAEIDSLFKEDILGYKGYPVTEAQLFLFSKGRDFVENLLEKRSSSFWTEIRVHLMYPTIMSFITFWIGFWLGHKTH